MGDHLKTDLYVLLDLENVHQIDESIPEKHGKDLTIALHVAIGPADEANFTDVHLLTPRRQTG